MRYRRGMYDFAGKSFCSRLRDLGCPDTLIKDVRDVAAAVMCSEGPGQSRKKLNRLEIPGHLKQSRYNRLQGKTCEALFGNLNFLKGTLKSPKTIFNTRFLPLNGEAPMCCEESTWQLAIGNWPSAERAASCKAGECAAEAQARVPACHSECCKGRWISRFESRVIRIKSRKI